MITSLGLILFILCLAIHEMGHAFAMRKHGIVISEICLFGIGGPKSFSFKWKKVFGDAEITMRPLIPLGAFVKPIGDDVSKLSRDKQVDIFSAGIANNLYFGFAILTVTSLLNGVFTTSLIFASICAALFLIFRFAKAAFIISIGVSVTAISAYLLIKDISGAGSIVSIFRIINDQNSIIEAIVMCAAISISLGLANAMPLFGLDGHGVINLYLPKKVRPVVNIVGGIALLALLIISIGNDVISLF